MPRERVGCIEKIGFTSKEEGKCLFTWAKDDKVAHNWSQKPHSWCSHRFSKRDNYCHLEWFGIMIKDLQIKIKTIHSQKLPTFQQS